MPEIGGKLAFCLNLRYYAHDEKIWFREEDRLGDFTRAKGLQKPFWDRGKPRWSYNFSLTNSGSFLTPLNHLTGHHWQ